MTSNLFVVGINRHRAPLEIREELSFTRGQARELLPRLASCLGVQEALLLSTCNRTEVYGYGSPESAIPAILNTLRAARPEARALDKSYFRFVELGDDAVRHLFRVAAGIESQILGDTHIVAQVKEAFHMAGEAGTLGAYLDRAVTEALRAAKRARRETRIGEGSASIGGAVLRSIRASFAEPKQTGILVLGAGEAGRDIARHLAKANLGTLSFSARNPEQARAMAREFSGHAVEWDCVAERLALTDVLITATSGRLAFLDGEALQKAAGRGSGFLIIDAGNPRNVDPAAAELAGVKILNLEALNSEQDEALLARRLEIPRVETILNRDLERWRNWRRRRAVPPPHVYPFHERRAGALNA